MAQQHSQTKSRDLILNIKNQGGSVEHYYHFLLGFFVPLVNKIIDLECQDIYRRIYIRSCAIMDDIIHELGYSKIVICEKGQHLDDMIKSHPTDGIAFDHVTVDGYDNPPTYDGATFRKVSDYLQERLSKQISVESRLIWGEFPKNINIVIINRAPSHIYYKSDASEAKLSGTDRRSIPNFDQMVTAIANYYPNILIIFLENKSLSHQIALFRGADIIIAQHGAALANLIWAKEGTKIIEIVPPDLAGRARYDDFFGRLALCLGQSHDRINQQHSHADVNLDLVLTALQRIAEPSTQSVVLKSAQRHRRPETFSFTTKGIKRHLDGKDPTILLTGLPRSGTNLICSLLNKCPDTVALAEPLALAPHGNREHAVHEIEDFIKTARHKIEYNGEIVTRHVHGVIPDNWVELPRANRPLRRNISEIGLVKLNKVVSHDFTLIIKQPAEFSALSDLLVGRYPLVALIRHPLDVLASWQTVNMPVNTGHMPVAEAFNPHLAATLAAVPERLKRQVALLGWLLRLYRGFPPDQVLRYEDLIAAPNDLLSRFTPHSCQDIPMLTNVDPVVRYPDVDFHSLATELLSIKSIAEIFYPDFEDSLARYLERTGRPQADRRDRLVWPVKAVARLNLASGFTRAIERLRQRAGRLIGN